MTHKMRIITNNVPRRLHLYAALPPRVRKDFDYLSIDDDTPRMVLYKGVWYDVLDSESPCTLPVENPLRQWGGFIRNSFFSGVVFKVADDGNIICGRFVV